MIGMNRKPVITLLILPPLIAEVLSGSSPPVEIMLNPLAFPLLMGLYGTGALLIREVAVRLRLNYVSILLFGAAYGVWEEGVAVKSFFDPKWVDLGPLGTYGRAWGVNWIWALWLTIYHAVISITVPIVLVECLYGRDRPWLGKRGILTALAVFLLTSLLINIGLTPYAPEVWQYGLCLLMMSVLVYVGLRGVPLPPATWKPRARALWLLGIPFVLLGALAFNAPAGTGLPAPACGALGLAIYLLYAYPYMKTVWNDTRLFAAAGGLSLSLLPFGVIVDLTHGFTGVTVANVLYLLWLMRRWRGFQNGSSAP